MTANCIYYFDSIDPHEIDLNNKFYVYVQFDPTSGIIKNNMDGNYIIENFQPYYVGKGIKSRWKWSTCLKSTNDRTLKAYFVRKIEKENLLPLVVLWAFNLEQEEALELEKRLVEFWGRLDIQTGILCNHTPGGDESPTLNVGHTLEARLKMSASQKKRVEIFGPRLHTEEHKQKLKNDNPGGRATAKSVYQIDCNTGLVINEYASARAAGISNNFDGKQISRVCRDGKYNSICEFYWRFTTSKEIIDGKLVNFEEYNRRRTSKSQYHVIQYSETYEIIKVWQNFYEAANRLNLSYGSIWSATKCNNLYANSYWKKQLISK